MATTSSPAPLTVSTHSLRPGLVLTLRLAALYNILWGAWQILLPDSFFGLLGMPENNYPMIWQGMGMVIGVYGVAYWLASYDYIRHWPIVFVGFLGKIFGPAGWIWGVITGTAPLAFGYTLIFNDLIWWIPFALMLREAWRAGLPVAEERKLLEVRASPGASTRFPAQADASGSAPSSPVPPHA